MVGVFAHSGGSFKPATSIPVNNGGTWQNAQEVWAKDNGVWVKVFPAEVREPATGETFIQGHTSWFFYSSVGQGGVNWDGALLFMSSEIQAGTTSFKYGSWTYYRGTHRVGGNIAQYAIYRIGTP